jgi:hypothetical protein
LSGTKKISQIANDDFCLAFYFYLPFILWFRRLELGEVTREMTAADDFLGSVRDPNVKEIIAKG